MWVQAVYTAYMRSDFRYIAIDLKSFYASVECQECGLDPLTTNLVVADVSRTQKTICLAVSPSLKAYRISGRARLFEVTQRVSQINEDRLRTLKRRTNHRQFAYSSFDDTLVRQHPEAQLAFLAAKPRMALYLDYSTRVYEVYLRYFAPEDIHVYSIDEVLIDAGSYLRTYKLDARELASRVIADILQTTGITATAGIGTNLYLAKVAMDILAKHEEPDENGVRIAILDEDAYKHRLWNHEPITDFWRVGRGYARRLAAHSLLTMGDVARCSLGGPHDRLNEDLLFNLFGKNAELLIDHAWGAEPVTMAHIKKYQPHVRSTVAGQVLHAPYEFEDARLVAWEMAEQLGLDLTGAGLKTDTLVLTVGYDRESLSLERVGENAEDCPVVTDHYGRVVPKPAHGTKRLRTPTSSGKQIARAVLGLFDELVNPRFLARKISIAAERLVTEEEIRQHPSQLSLFADEEDVPPAELEREQVLQKTMLDIKERFGKNAVLKAASLQDAATARQRNQQIGGHSA